MVIVFWGLYIYEFSCIGCIMNNKKVVIIIGSGWGIGVVIVKLFVMNGYVVCVNYKLNVSIVNVVVEEI